MGQLSTERPRISVLIPAHNAARYIRQCLVAVENSAYDNYECIVVDDASTDDTTAVAESYNCRVVVLPRNLGPAAARNRAVSESTGDILFFVDADVCVAPDSLQRVADRFTGDPQLEALIGSYDDRPAHDGFLSQYRNLVHHHVHQTANETAWTFWSGCGAIRRDVLLHYGGFSGDYKRPAIEDIELGYRMRADGRRILLDKDLQVTHLKPWSFGQMIRTDIFDRGIPWTELIWRDQHMPSDLNLRASQRISVVLTHLLLWSLVGSAAYFGAAAAGPLAALGLLLAGNYWLHDAILGRRGSKTWASIAAATGAFAGFAWVFGFGSLLVPTLAAIALTGLRHRLFGRRGERWARMGSVLAAAGVAATSFYLAGHLPTHPAMLVPALLLASVIALNSGFYWFLWRSRGFFFTLAAIPFHLLYHFYNGISFATGTFFHWTGRGFAKEKKAQQTAATVD